MGQTVGPLADPEAAKDVALRVEGMGRRQQGNRLEVDMRGQVGLARVGKWVVKDVPPQRLQGVAL